MRIEEEVKLDYKDVLIRPKRSALRSRSEVDLYRSFKLKNSKSDWKGIPIMAANMDGVGTFSMAKSLQAKGLFTCITKHYAIEDWRLNIGDLDRDRVAISIGTNMDAYLKASAIVKELDLRWICIDIANGYSEHFVEFVKLVRSDFPNKNIIAGNVVTADMTQELILAGADFIKIGIGPGSVCISRIQTGVGYPQLSAVMECADAAHGLGGHIIADGGCTCPGDVAKAFAAGADFVMLGGMFAGHDQSGGEVIKRHFVDGECKGNFRVHPIQIYKTKKTIKFYGMSSVEAMEKHSGGMANYRSSEGRVVEVPYKGDVDGTVLNLLGGIRSTCTYVGSSNLKQLSKCTTFIRCSQQFNSVFLK